MTKTKSVKTKKKVNKGGRPLFDGKNKDIVIQKLEEVWAIGGTDEEAAFYAEISKAALSDYLKKHKDVSERKEALKNKPILKARMTVVKSLDQPDHAKWYLERKRKKEFTAKSEVDLSGQVDSVTKIEIIKPK